MNELLSKSNDFKQEYCCTIVRIGEVLPIEGSDFHGQVMVEGRTIVVRKDQVKEGDVMFYVSNECQVNADFLSINSFYDDATADKAHTKEYKRGYWRFERRLNNYLEQNEPTIYSKIQYHKTHPEWDADKKKWRNTLSRDLVKKEVEYIQHCLSMLPQGVKFYTIHDCICCKQSDAELVKQKMEESSLELYGLVIRLKIENNEPTKIAV